MHARCTLATAQTRSVSIARLKTPANLSRTLQEARFIILIVAPTKEVRPASETTVLLQMHQRVLVMSYISRILHTCLETIL